jgi:hypothetical protein
MVSRETEMELLSDEELRDIALFKERVLDLSESKKKYKINPWSRYSINPEMRVDTFYANTPDIDHIIILAIKFRFFYAQTERIQFEKIANLLRKKAKDEWARNYIDRVKSWYKLSMNSTGTTGKLGHPITNREIINLWFNSKFFHPDVSKRIKLDDIHKAVGEKASLFQLYLAIVTCSNNIQLLYSVAHKLQVDNQCLCTPNHHFEINK